MPISESKYRSRSFNFGHKEPQYRHLDATQDKTRLHDVVDTQIKPTYGSLAEEEHAFISSQDILRKSDPTKSDDGIPTEISTTRKAAIYAVSTILNVSTLGFLHGLAVVYVVVIDELQVPSAEAALMMSVTRGVMYGSGFLSSWILGIVGPIKCTILGGILVSSGLIASSLAQNIALIVLFLGILTGLGGGLLSITGFSTIAHSYRKRTSLALAFASMGSMIGSCIFPYIFQLLIDVYGWRGTFLIYGGYMFNTFVGAYILRLCVSDEMKFVKRSLRSSLDIKVFYIPAFKFYLLANFLWGVFGAIPWLFTADVMHGLGFSEDVGAGFLTILGLSAVIGTLMYGFIRECFRFSAMKGLPFGCIFFAGTLFLFAIFDDYWLLFGVSVANGLGNGLFTMCNTLVPHQIVGTELYSTAMGILNTVYGVGNALSGPLGGWIKDSTGNYDMLFYVAAGGVILNCILHSIVIYLTSRRHQT